MVTLRIVDFMRQLYITESALNVDFDNYVTLEKSLDLEDP